MSKYDYNYYDPSGGQLFFDAIFNSINGITQQQTDNIRVTRLNTWQYKKYKTQNGLLKFTIIVCVIIIALTLIKKNFKYLDEMAYRIIIGIIVGLSVVYIASTLWMISRKDNMNFDEIDFGSGPGYIGEDTPNINNTLGGIGCDISFADISFNPASDANDVKKSTAIDRVNSMF